MKDHRLIRAKHLPGGDPEQQGIPELTGSTGHRNTQGVFPHQKPVGSLHGPAVPGKVFHLARRLVKVALPQSGCSVPLDFSWIIFDGRICLSCRR
jgi:hypothetical protein